jgi:hypothetical protein
MKLEYLENTTNGNFLHMLDFSNDEVMEIKKLIDQMTRGRINEVVVHEHALINPIDNAHLVLKMGPRDEGIHYDQENKEFVCVLTKSSYENMSQLIVSFAEHALEMEGFEWLDETSDISLLISPSKRWE